MAPQKKRITHQDVARLAGVSTATVSYVVNNGPRSTSPEARERVLKAIEDLDYHPNAFARGLRAGRTNTIAVIDNDYHAMTVFSSPYTAGILTGLTACFKANGYYILVHPVMVGEALSDTESLLHSGRLDGVVIRLVQDPPATDMLLELVASAGIPCVCIEVAAAPRFGFSAVTYENTGGGYAATSYLIAQGHRRIGYIGGDPRYITARGRLAGYRRALTDHGLPCDDALVTGGDWVASIAGPSVAQLMALEDAPTAIFAASDMIAFTVLEELRNRRVRVPEDIAVIGFDDIQLASEVTPRLTTVRIPLFELGQRAGNLILDLVQAEHDGAARAEILPVELIRRESA